MYHVFLLHNTDSYEFMNGHEFETGKDMAREAYFVIADPKYSIGWVLDVSK